MKIIVTGGAGFIGSHLVERLLRQGHDVLVVDNLWRGRIDNLPPQVPIFPIDLENNSPLTLPADVIFHLAAKVTGIHYNRLHQFDMMQRNLAINWKVAEWVANVRPSLYVYVSTACVYPHDAPVPTPESCGDVCNPEPTNFGYGVAKWVGEQQARFIHREYGVPTLVVRFFNAFGPRDYYDWATSHVAPALIRRVMEGQDPVEIWGSGNQSRALVDARDIAEALVRLMGCPAAHNAEPVNIGHRHEVTIRELFEAICKVSGRHPHPNFRLDMPEGYPRRAADTTRLKELVGWVPGTPLETTLADMVQDYQRQVEQGTIVDKE